MKKILRILTAWWFWITNKNNKMAQERLHQCAPCELRKWLVCSECGCPLFAKSRLVDEECPHPKGNKWVGMHLRYSKK